MSAARVNDEHAVRRAVHPDAIFLLPLGIYAEGVIGSVADLEDGGRFEERAGKKKTKESDEPCAQETSDGNPYQPSALLVHFTGFGTDGRQTGSSRCFRCTDGRRTNIFGCICATGSGRLRRFRLWFGRISFRARHAIPPGFLVLENNRRLPKAPPVPPLRYGPADRELVLAENRLVLIYGSFQE